MVAVSEFRNEVCLHILTLNLFVFYVYCLEKGTNCVFSSQCENGCSERTNKHTHTNWHTHIERDRRTYGEIMNFLGVLRLFSAHVHVHLT